MAKRRKKKGKFDAKTVARELSAAVDEDIATEDVEEEDFFGYTTFVADAERYVVFESYEEAHDAAVDVVADDLRHDPSMFNQDWLMGHVDQDRLKRWVYDAVLEDEYAHEIARDDPERFWGEAEQWGVSVPDEDEREDEDPEDYADDLAEAIAKDRAKDPMGWLEDIWGDGAAAKAMEVGGLDIDSAASDAVSIDGWAHFLSRYDGDYQDLPSGFVYYKGPGY